MPDHISLVEIRERKTLNVLEHIHSFQQATAAGVGEIDLRDVSRDYSLRVKTKSGHEHLHLLGSCVLRFVKNDKRIIQSTPAHERDGCNLDDVLFQITVHSLGIEHVIERVVKRTEIWIDF